MKKNNKTNNVTLWYKWVKSPDFLRKFFVFAAVFILLMFSTFLIWKRHMEKEIGQAKNLIRTPPPPQADKPVKQSPLSPPSQLKLLSDHLTALENRMNQQQGILLIPSKLVAIELLRAILEGWIPLETLKTFLQKNAEPWAQDLLLQLNPIQESKTYSQLEDLLTILPSQPLSTWEYIKRKIKSLINIRKLDKKGDYKLGQLEDVQKAIHAHNIQNALEGFEKLPPQEKTELSCWKRLAQDRLTLEIMIKKLLLELTKG